VVVVVAPPVTTTTVPPLTEAVTVELPGPTPEEL